MLAYYNENDPYAAAWLRNLIEAKLIAKGEVDERSIVEVKASELRGYTQCHFFAGIGGWSHALRLAGWPDTREAWTGSCPCQPFSVAGKRQGEKDERHLWPVFRDLIRKCRPSVVFGEQVASKDALGWLDAVHADMERSRYAFAAVDLCAAGVEAPHIRQRLYWVADAQHPERGAVHEHREDGRDGAHGGREEAHGELGARGEVRRMADAGRERRQQNARGASRDEAENGGARRVGGEPNCDYVVASSCSIGRLADAEGNRQPREHLRANGKPKERASQTRAPSDWSSTLDSFWQAADWLCCRDGKWRSVEPGTFPLAHGAASRVGRLRAYGNAIVPQVAAEVIRAFMET